MIDKIAKVLEVHFPLYRPDGSRGMCVCGEDEGLEWPKHMALKLIDFDAGLFERVRLLEDKFRHGGTLMRLLAQQAGELAGVFTGEPLLRQFAQQLSALATAFDALSDLDNRNLKPRCVVTNEPVDEARLLVDVPKPCDCVVCSMVREHLLHRIMSEAAVAQPRRSDE